MATLTDNELAYAAQSFQTANYSYVSVITIWLYDYFLTLDDEIRYLRNSNLTKVKVLYIATRSLPFAMLGIWGPKYLKHNTVNQCNVLGTPAGAVNALMIVCAESMFIVRTYALWGLNKRILDLVLTTFITVAAAAIGIVFVPDGTTVFVSLPISITGCFMLKQGNLFAVTFALLIVFELELVTLTVIRVIKVHQYARGDLARTLIQHNVFYFVCGLFFSILNIITVVSLKYGYSGMLDKSAAICTSS
ncbi:hypothetical protein CONPUDRAFT_148306 [Coniophora puteana RWD-64-598 SS2]|uniref:DUF6533 domain-containing protein n=1 Tax=Coniophora puteana (strain RWD-64-598) TaxID=741705 RepID=A0A5M3N460_CONPW|nr:uncharacterized protein CONPUDRAFT_148306 [Coniophora puteana RWD-64-598 SS2]EIW86210.1 hypothetical protein CONPUDRAFT_148306 [Coniophora puteana RWD-64-598 SS2]